MMTRECLAIEFVHKACDVVAIREYRFQEEKGVISSIVAIKPRNECKAMNVNVKSDCGSRWSPPSLQDRE